MASPEELIAEYLLVSSQAVHTGIVSERLAACMVNVGTIADSINRVAEFDTEVGPELGAAVEYAKELAEALESAHDFVMARYEVAMARMLRLAAEAEHDSKGGGNAEA